MTTDAKYRPIDHDKIRRGHMIRATLAGGHTTIEGPVINDGVMVGLSILGTARSILSLHYAGATFEAKLKRDFMSKPKPKKPKTVFVVRARDVIEEPTWIEAVFTSEKRARKFVERDREAFPYVTYYVDAYVVNDKKGGW